MVLPDTTRHNYSAAISAFVFCRGKIFFLRCSDLLQSEEIRQNLRSAEHDNEMQKDNPTKAS